jgi:hypothetical protein
MGQQAKVDHLQMRASLLVRSLKSLALIAGIKIKGLHIVLGRERARRSAPMRDARARGLGRAMGSQEAGPR